MRFMMFMIPNISDEDWTPPVEAVEAMTKYNEELTKAGRPARAGRPASRLRRGAGVVPGRQGHRERRALRRGQGGRRGLLAHRGEVQGRGRRVGQAHARRRRPRDRGAPGLRDRGLPARLAGGRRPARRSGAQTPRNARAQARWPRGEGRPRPDDRDPPRHRRGLADRVGPAHRRPGPLSSATSAWPRTWPTTRWSPRSSSGPRTGVPDNPGAWLMATGKRRAIDLLRRRSALERKHEELGRELEQPRQRAVEPDFDAARRRLRRRPAAPDLHRLPSRPLHRGAGRR